MSSLKTRTFVTYDRSKKAGCRPIGGVQRGRSAQSFEKPVRTSQGIG